MLRPTRIERDYPRFERARTPGQDMVGDWRESRDYRLYVDFAPGNFLSLQVYPDAGYAFVVGAVFSPGPDSPPTASVELFDIEAFPESLGHATWAAFVAAHGVPASATPVHPRCTSPLDDEEEWH